MRGRYPHYTILFIDSLDRFQTHSKMDVWIGKDTMVIRLHFFVVAAFVLCALPVRASVLSASGQASVSGPPSNSKTDISAITPVASVGPLLVNDSNSGQGAASAYGDVYGTLTVATHGCVEPDAMTGHTSSAGGNASITFSDTFKIQSATVPAGTPLMIDFCVAAGYAAQTSNEFPNNDSSSVVNNAQASFGAAIGASTGSTTGVYSFAQSFNQITTSSSGLFSDPNGVDFKISGNVGQNCNVTVNLTAGSAADIAPLDIGDVQVQAILVWGAVSETSGVTLVSVNTGVNMPDMTNCTPAYLQANTPPPLIELPEPSTFVLAVLAFGTMWWRFRCNMGQSQRHLIPVAMPSTR
jgi:hypothetical protein